MLCHRNCGLEATYTNRFNLPCCDRSASKCPVVKEKIGKSNSVVLKGNKLSQKQLEALAKSRSGRVVSQEVREKISISNKQTKSKQTIVPWNKGIKTGHIPWNKGLKKRDLKPIEGNDIVYQNFKKYRNRVAVRTKNTYEQNKQIINPNNLPLGKCGVPDAYQIDHIISVREGFEKGIPIEEIAGINNLQILPWLDNIKKYDGTRKL
jgi:hypothetical protein